MLFVQPVARLTNFASLSTYFWFEHHLDHSFSGIEALDLDPRTFFHLDNLRSSEKLKSVSCSLFSGLGQQLVLSLNHKLSYAWGPLRQCRPTLSCPVSASPTSKLFFLQQSLWYEQSQIGCLLVTYQTNNFRWGAKWVINQNWLPPYLSSTYSVFFNNS